MADTGQGYQGFSTGQIFNPEELDELKRELSKAFTSTCSSWTMLIKPSRCLSHSFSEQPHLSYKVSCGRRRKFYRVSYHIRNKIAKSLFSFSIICCIPSEPWSICNIQRLSYSGSNQISLFHKQVWHKPWSDASILCHQMKYRPDQSSISLSQSQ